MIQTFRSVLLVVCLLLVTQIGFAQADPKLRQAAEARPESWQQYVSYQGRFTVLFPGKPTASEEIINIPPGRFVMHKTQLQTLQNMELFTQIIRNQSLITLRRRYCFQ